MYRESEQYRFGRIEGYIITLARLQEQFEDTAVNLEEMEAAVARQLAKDRVSSSKSREDGRAPIELRG